MKYVLWSFTSRFEDLKIAFNGVRRNDLLKILSTKIIKNHIIGMKKEIKEGKTTKIVMEDKVRNKI